MNTRLAKLLSPVVMLCVSACAADAGLRGSDLQSVVSDSQSLQRAISSGDSASALYSLLSRDGSSPSRRGDRPAAAGPDAPSSGSAAPMLDTGERFFPHDIVQYWRAHPNATPQSASSSANARGHVIAPKPEQFGVLPMNKNKPGVAAMRIKLATALAEVAKSPSLSADLRGVSLSPGGAIGMRQGGPLTPSVAGNGTWIAYPLTLDKTRTFYQHPDGTYSHAGSGEGPSINITVNDPAYIESSPVPVGTYNGYTILDHGGGFGILIVTNGRPALVEQQSGKRTTKVLNPDLIDPTRPPSEIQMLFVYVGCSSDCWRRMSQGRTDPTSGEGRLIAALFNTDWEAVLKKLQ